ncbi:amino acid ABC transporter substrate-binding protein, PAAT family /amino acid ABC transporter membrane protein, PAAT family [Nocardioides scoriae]|uniref:Amino acid ABC transporter substrate-binding protein, PAAT family /amino acid ABC transporter membrane protein, PAAT family n=1 Tax=Nocardioides scoriae TaxID=642780 RepID=A0A1H1PX44_9ACTN|nr:ABC transporter permease subunit [Nocardioides scoriae]SDS15567.1 amino acid ABC transporter substrate-binding protein, PAAT family /amino acid ABC transporter membrane protein, PAAT family [Nocardioides scoriae]
MQFFRCRATAPASFLLAVLGLLVLLAGPAQAADGDGPLVRVGTEGTYPPFTYEDPDTGDLTGYDVDVMKAVAKEAGWRVQFATSQFDAIFGSLDSGRIDAVANQITINPERQARYLFSEPYTYSRGVIVTAKDDDSITTLADLKGRTTAQSETSNWSQVAKDAGAKVENVDQFSQAATLLAQGRVDAIVNDNIAVLDYLKTSGSDAIKIAGYAGDDVSEQALTFRKDEPQLQRQADQALQELRADGTLSRLSEKYFGTDVSSESSTEVDLQGDRQRSTWQVLRGAAGPMLWGMLKGTIPLTVVSFVLGLALGLVVALGRLSQVRVLRAASRFFISVIRGTPLLVQLFIVFYGLGQVGLKLDPFVAATVAFSLNVAGYAAEIIRAAILSVPRGQFEAASSIGMDRGLAMRRIVLPQASRIAVPPLGNTLLSLVKDTSLAAVVLVDETFRAAVSAAATSFEYLPLYCLAALYYWIVCFLISSAQKPLERRLGRYVA